MEGLFARLRGDDEALAAGTRAPAAGLEALNRLLLQLYDEPHDTRDGWSNCLEHLRCHFDAKQAVFIVRRRVSGDPSELIISGDLPCEEARQLFFERYSAIDPFANLPPERVCTIADVLSNDEWVESEFYRKYLQPQNLAQVMGADIGIAPDYVLAFRICRSPEDAIFSDSERSEFQFVLVHLRRIAQARMQTSTLEANHCISTGLMDTMNLGMVVLDQCGQVLHINPAAERQLQRRDGISLTNGSLRATDYHDNQPFQKLIQQALLSSREQGELVGTIGLRRADADNPLGIAIRSLAARGAVCGIRQATVSVLFSSGVSHGRISESALRSIFSLTNAETRLAMALTKGLTIDEVAHQLRVSRNTIRTHLNGLFAKTGTNRQSEVIRVLLGSIAALC